MEEIGEEVSLWIVKNPRPEDVVFQVAINIGIIKKGLK